MDNRGFFTVLNKYYKGKPMQFIPAPLTTKAPPFPFATYQTRTSDTDYIKLDERDVTENKIIHKATAKTTDELIIKCYHKSEVEAYRLALEVMDLINFKQNSEIRRAGYGIISVERLIPLHEKTDNSYIFCYALTAVIDYNHTTTREYDKLKVLEITGDIEKNINMEEK